MGFKKETRLKALYNYENKIIRKVYWIDGKSQLRFINLENSIANGDYEELIDIKLENINQVGLFNISQPTVEVLSNGGSHTAGTIQYAYNLYKINGNQTKLSPLSIMVSLGNGDINGGNVNELVTDLPKITLEDIDSNYTNIRVYAIKYTSFNGMPEISIIYDAKIDDHRLFTLYDTGTLKIQDISVEQLLFIGSDPVYPKEMASKDNHLFLANYEESTYELKNLDLRVFPFRSNSNTITFSDAFEEVKDTDGDIIDAKAAPHSKSFSMSKDNLSKLPPKQFVQNYIDRCLYTATGALGMSGKYIEVLMPRVFNNGSVDPEFSTNLLKDNELYRYAIKFYNGYGQYTEPMFLGDYYTGTHEDPTKTNKTGWVIKPSIGFTMDFFDYYYDDENFKDITGKFDVRLRPVGYKVLRARRRPEDRLNVLQGIVNTMVSTNPSKTAYNLPADERNVIMEAGYKIPWLMRTRSNKTYPIMGYKHGSDIGETGNPYGAGKRNTEVFTSVSTKNKRTATFQYTKLMQFYSPELTFNEVNNINTKFFRMLHTSICEDSVYAAEINTASLEKDIEVKALGRLSPRANESIVGLNEMEINELLGDPSNLFDYSLVGPSGGGSAHSVQMYRDFTSLNSGVYEQFKGNKQFKTLGNPVLVEKGQGITSYNGIAKYTFSNKFDRFRTDNPRNGSGSTDDPKGKSAITKLNSFNERNITFVESKELTMEQLLRDNLNNNTEFTEAPIFEFVRPISHYYMNNMYGGNQGSRLNSEYVEIGEYRNIFTEDGLDREHKEVKSPGDTFVSDFEFQKISCDQELYTEDAYNLIEIVKFKVETSVDLNRRSDLSRYPWDSFFMPKYLDYTKYNRVYSQQDNIFKNVNNAYNFKSAVEYGNRIIASRQKNSGELIDSWTDLMVNNIMDLDGKYGSITNLVSLPAGLLSLQSGATAMIAVNPRAQVVGSDGISIELGTGTVLNDYRYITTSYGSNLYWNAIQTKTGVYFYDHLNKTICNYTGETVMDLVKSKAITSKFKKYIDTVSIGHNPLLNNGIAIGYSNALGDVYFSFMNNNCMVFNELSDHFVGTKSYDSPLFVSYGELTYCIDKDNLDTLYLNFAGEYNKFFGRQEDSFIEFIFNPEPLVECVLNNMSVKLNDSYGVDTNTAIWDSIQVRNDYQDSGIVPLVNRANYRKLSRITNITFPRNKNTRDRMRDTWHHITLRTDNVKNGMMLNNAMNLSYKPLYIDVKE